MNTKDGHQGKSDLRQEAFIMRVLPAALRPYAVLGRFDRLIGVWLLVLPGWWSIALASGDFNARTVWLLLLFGVGAFAMRAAGCVINDIWDRDLDKQVERTRVRPLAAGELSVRQAAGFLGVLLLIGLAVLLQMNALTILLGVCSLPLIVAYPLMKRITWWPQAFLGLTFNFGALMGASAVSGGITLAPLLLYAGAIFWTLGYDTVYAHQDKEDDALAGIKSTALKFGGRSKVWVAGFYGLAFGLMYSALSLQGDLYGLALLPAAAHLGWQLWRWDLEEPDSALAVFKSNRDCGVLILAAALFSLL